MPCHSNGPWALTRLGTRRTLRSLFNLPLEEAMKKIALAFLSACAR
jgi:hypothetical protein